MINSGVYFLRFAPTEMNKTILVCDDNQDILEMLVLLLESYGYNVISENCSPKLFTTIAKERLGLVIIDLWMPLMPGDEVIKQLRKSPETELLPVIVISACIDGKQTAYKAGASYFISKPFDIFNLISKVEEYYSQAS